MSEHRPGMGAFPTEGGFAFRVWAPHADAVRVVGDFNGWDHSAHALHQEGNGHWYGEVAGAEHGQEYKLILTNGEDTFFRIDPRALAVTNSVGNGILYDHGRFDWDGDERFETPGQHQLVIYETHIGSFMATADGGPADLHEQRHQPLVRAPGERVARLGVPQERRELGLGPVPRLEVLDELLRRKLGRQPPARGEVLELGGRLAR